MGFADGPRNSTYLVEQINKSITAINNANIGYTINDYFTVDNTVDVDGNLLHDKFNHLHRYFEDLQGVSGKMSNFYLNADANTRWHIRQLNLLCHEFECWSLSYVKKLTAPSWQRPSQLMCWLNAPRFVLEDSDYEMFGIESMNRPLGAVYVGVNKAVGKHHWEVFNDEGNDSRIDELVTSTLRSQTEAAGDFDIEWGNNPGKYTWQQSRLNNFRQWLIDNKFDPEDKKLTIGHPQVGQVDLLRTFNSESHEKIWPLLNAHLNVYSIRTSNARAVYSYNWDNRDYAEKQIKIIAGDQC